jgi:hypothetical protein
MNANHSSDEQVLLRPIPFEDRESIPPFWKRVGETFVQSFKDPLSMYVRIGEGTSLIAPWRFTLLLSLPVFLFMLIYAIIGLILVLAASYGPSNQERIPLMVIGGILICMPLVTPILQFLGMLFWGFILHVCLWLWGGTRQSVGLLQTVRATGYTYAFVNLVSFVPIVGLLAILATPVMLGMGLARLHRTETWRGVCAAFTPLALCLCMLIGSISLFVGWMLRQAEKERNITMPPAIFRHQEKPRELPERPEPNRA